MEIGSHLAQWKGAIHHIAKRLDKFLIHEELVDRMGILKSEVYNTFISNHLPITLIWCAELNMKGLPFKFNQIWMDDPDFNILIMEFWTQDDGSEVSPMMALYEKLHKRKIVVKKWERWKREDEQRPLDYQR